MLLGIGLVALTALPAAGCCASNARDRARPRVINLYLGAPIPVHAGTRAELRSATCAGLSEVVEAPVAHRHAPRLARPTAVVPFARTALAGQGQWRPSGRPVSGLPAIYETASVPPGGGAPAGIAWMDTRLLRATLYSGSGSPGGLGWRYTAPIEPAQARTLVAAFNGGFYMSVSGGGYYSEGRLVAPLRAGAASLVIDASGYVNIGVWGSDVTMTPNVVSVRQNLVPLVAGGYPTPFAATSDWLAWGATCGAYSCSGTGIENQWRSGLGITANGALVYVAGPSLSPLQLAQILVRARAVRAMELDINPYWTVFATHAPSSPNAFASTRKRDGPVVDDGGPTGTVLRSVLVPRLRHDVGPLNKTGLP